jgi:2-keto-4-pentenoate hydratase/2-oxohepta-3-ene-1,7-dioic acid hydratase in catechol pathway
MPISLGAVMIPSHSPWTGRPCESRLLTGRGRSGADTTDTFALLGPVILDAAAAPPVSEPEIRTLVNGDGRQHASCSLMITGAPELIARISAGITLKPGDIIASGRPSVVAAGIKHPAYLQPGDKVCIEISGVGELANEIAGPR